MELFETIRKRHCYRAAFKPGPIPRADLQKIVQAGLDAPSGKNIQTTTFVIVDDPALVSQITPMHTAGKSFQQARAFVACIIDRAPASIYEGMSFQVEDCAAAVENMLLAVTAMGYASVWIDGWLRVDERNTKIGDLLGVPRDKVIRILLPIGIPAENYPSPAKKPFAERAWFNKYGG
ncbi:MAG: nitroreductase family protein [Planctomycetaceae bacterium]|nr:nitroreductase family protein [Planctomycetaceae bacterium]